MGHDGWRWHGEGRFDTFMVRFCAFFFCYILGTLFVMFYLLVDEVFVLVRDGEGGGEGMVVFGVWRFSIGVVGEGGEGWMGEEGGLWMKICREWKFLSVGLVDGVSW